MGNMYRKAEKNTLRCSDRGNTTAILCSYSKAKTISPAFLPSEFKKWHASRMNWDQYCQKTSLVNTEHTTTLVRKVTKNKQCNKFISFKRVCKCNYVCARFFF